MSASPAPLFRTQPLFPFIQEHHCPRLILLSLLGGLIIKLIITYKVAQEWSLLGQVASKCFGLSSANRARASTSLLITVLSASKETNWSDWFLPLIGLSLISEWAKILLVMVRLGATPLNLSWWSTIWSEDRELFFDLIAWKPGYKSCPPSDHWKSSSKIISRVGGISMTECSVCAATPATPCTGCHNANYCGETFVFTCIFIFKRISIFLFIFIFHIIFISSRINVIMIM